jgi:hypothetical protein
MEIIMKMVQKTIISSLVHPTTVSLKKRFIKIGCNLLFTSLVLITDACSAGSTISEDRLFNSLHLSSSHQRLHKTAETISYQKISQEEVLQKWEREEAKKTICGVVAMYGEDVNFGKKITYSLQLGNYISDVDATYTYATRTFYLPRVHINGQIIFTANDKGIVSHESGHMVLSDIRLLGNTSHTGAFHEAFGDLTAHFYRFYNQATRQQSINMLENNQGCVGDNNFTCVRNNAKFLALGHTSCEVHELSKPFTSAVYNNMLDAFATRDANYVEKYVAGEIMGWHRRTLVKAVLSLNTSTPTLMDMAQQMLVVSLHNSQYRDGLGRNFIKNNLIVLMYKFLPTPRYPNQITSFYSPNEKFSTLCLVKKKPHEARRGLNGLYD